MVEWDCKILNEAREAPETVQTLVEELRKDHGEEMEKVKSPARQCRSMATLSNDTSRLLRVEQRKRRLPAYRVRGLKLSTIYAFGPMALTSPFRSLDSYACHSYT